MPSTIRTPFEAQPRFLASTKALQQFVSDRAAAFSKTENFTDYYGGLDAVEAERFARLWWAFRASEVGAEAAAAEEAESLVRSMPDDEDGHGALVVRTFAEALLARAHGSVD